MRSDLLLRFTLRKIDSLRNCGKRLFSEMLCHIEYHAAAYPCAGIDDPSGTSRQIFKCRPGYINCIAACSHIQYIRGSSESVRGASDCNACNTIQAKGIVQKTCILWIDEAKNRAIILVRKLFGLKFNSL